MVPAFSGIALVGGVPDSVKRSGFTHYGYVNYVNNPLQTDDSQQMLARSLKMGFKTMIEFKRIDNKLTRIIHGKELDN